MANVVIRISNDPATLGPDATPDDVARYARALERAFAKTFECECSVVTEVRMSSTVEHPEHLSAWVEHAVQWITQLESCGWERLLDPEEIPEDAIKIGDHHFRWDALDEGRYALTILDPILDAEGDDQSRWPSDTAISDATGVVVGFSGEAVGREAIYTRMPAVHQTVPLEGADDDTTGVYVLLLAEHLGRVVVIDDAEELPDPVRALPPRMAAAAAAAEREVRDRLTVEATTLVREAREAGRDWARREWDAAPPSGRSLHWRGSWIDAKPLVGGESTEIQGGLAAIANDAAADEWVELQGSDQ